MKQVVREVEIEAPLFAQYEESYLFALGVPQSWLVPVRTVGGKGLERLAEHLPAEAYERLFALACGELIPTPDVPTVDIGPFSHPDAQRRFRVLDDQDELRRALNFPWDRWVVFLHPAQRSVILRRFTGAAKVYGGAGTGKSVVAMHRAARTEDVVRALEAGLRNAGGAADFSVPFLRSEWDAIIDPWGILTWPEYKAFSRAGRATPLGAKQRLQMWKIFEGARNELGAAGKTTWSGLCHEVARRAVPAPPFRHVIADEVQDFGPAELRLLRSLSPAGVDDLLVCGDAGQRIFVRPIALARVGIEVRGRSTRLRVNYRTTEQIRSFADRLLPRVDEGEGSESERRTVSLLRGPEPVVVAHRTIDAEIAGLADWVRGLQTEGYRPEEIGIFARTDTILRERVEPALRKLGLVPHPLRDEAPPSLKDVAIGTMHRARVAAT